MDKKESSFLSVMGRHHFEVEQAGGSLVIKKGKAGNSSVWAYLIFSAIAVAVGLALILFVSTKIGALVIGLSAPLLFQAANLKQREKDAETKSVEINEKEIALKEGFRVFRVEREKIQSLDIRVSEEGKLLAGCIYLIADGRHPQEFLEIFGDDREFLEDDLQAIADYVAEFISD
ncbi:MAG: hypothetical protein H6560_24670 [Lewinellaceae bacterium]|nr:hypothetical protein [Lewinellaceae bacterium]